MTRGPLVIDREGAAPAEPSMAPPVPDTGLATGPTEAGRPEPQAMRAAMALAARRSSRLGRWLLGSVSALVTFMLSLAAWDYANALLARSPILGWTATALLALALGVLLLLILRELAALSRLARIDTVRREAEAALAGGDLKAARGASDRIVALYAGRPELAAGLAQVKARGRDSFDADAVLALVEVEILGPLDQQARREIEAAARTVAAVTALVPIALADVVAALAANLRMIRRLSELYGGRAGALGSWRLARTVMTHLVATGAVAVGDDMIGSVAGGGLLSKVSRRFGEGIVNGALTARVGLAAMEVCRPLPFRTLPRPKVSNLLGRAMTGLFAKDG